MIIDIEIFQLIYLRKSVNGLFQFIVRWDIVLHLTVIKPLVCNHIKIAGSGQAKDNVLFLSRFPAL